MLHQDVLIRLCDARELLREAGDGRLSIREVARETGMSRFHFSRLFKAVFGETPKQCQLAARLELAKRLLMTTDLSVTDISMDAGFESLGTFSYLFARRLGMPPTAYRLKIRSIIRVPGETPAELIPGCFSLMCGAPNKIRNF